MSSSSKKGPKLRAAPSPIIETHCHLDYLKAKSLEDVLLESKEQGVEKFITIAVSPNNLDRVLEISETYPEVYCTQGIHPHEAKHWDQSVLGHIQRNIQKASKCVAVGEIGLDYHYNNSPRDIQITAFERQLDLASELNLPVVIHSRDADEDMMSVLKNQKSKGLQGVIHSFTSGRDLAETALGLEMYLGLNGIITFKNAENVREIARIVPLDKILLETDSPFLAPIPNRGRENSPAYLPWIGQYLAEVKEVGEEELLRHAYKNSELLFKL